MLRINRGALFSLLDGEAPSEYIWKQIRPERTAPFRSGEEE